EEDLPRLDSSKDLPQQVFKNYIDTIFESENSRLNYNKQLVMHWLIWLAKQMQEHRQEIFYLERIQMDWLPKEQFNRFLLCLLFGLAYGLYYGIIIGISGMIEANPAAGFATGLETTLIIASFFVLLNSCVLFN